MVPEAVEVTHRGERFVAWVEVDHTTGKALYVSTIRPWPKDEVDRDDIRRLARHRWSQIHGTLWPGPSLGWCLTKRRAKK